MGRTTHMLAAAAVFLLLAGGVRGEDVKVKVIDGDDPPAEQPSSPEASTTGTARAKLAASGDWYVDRALGKLELADEQVPRLNAVTQAHHTSVEAGRKEYYKRSMEYGKRMREVYKSGDKEQLTALQAEWSASSNEFRLSAEQQRRRLVEQLKAELTPAQADAMQEELDSYTTPAGQARRAASGLAQGYTRGIEVNDEQLKQIEAVLAKGLTDIYKDQKQFGEKLRQLGMQYTQARNAGDAKQAEAIRAQIRGLYQARSGSYARLREQAESVLTESQRQTLVKQRLEQKSQYARSYLDYALTPYRKLSLSEQQQADVAAARRAAEEAFAELDHSDWQARRELVAQLRRDIELLLTDEQKAELAETRRPPARGRGPGDEPGESAPQSD